MASPMSTLKRRRAPNCMLASLVLQIQISTYRIQKRKSSPCRDFLGMSSPPIRPPACWAWLGGVVFELDVRRVTVL